MDVHKHSAVNVKPMFSRVVWGFVLPIVKKRQNQPHLFFTMNIRNSPNLGIFQS